MAVAEARQDVRARLQLVDSLQKEGRIDDAVEELLRVAAVYTARNVPIKAVAVLRQAARLQPTRADVRMAYGEVFQKLRMIDDAARELRQACDLYHSQGEYGHELAAVARLAALDEGNLAAHLEVAEALSRAGRRGHAAGLFRTLATSLLEAGHIEDWEQVAERIIFHDPSDVTTAHDLALHYVRSGRYAEALSKLIICYESEPGDAELLELIIETLEFLGQRDRAASLTRQLMARFRRSGLQAEAAAALQRLYALDPDDEEAKRAVGVLAPVVQSDTVIELEAGEALEVGTGGSAGQDTEPGFVGDFIDELLDGSTDRAPELGAGGQDRTELIDVVPDPDAARRRVQARSGMPVSATPAPAARPAPRPAPAAAAPASPAGPRSALAVAREKQQTGQRGVQPGRPVSNAAHAAAPRPGAATSPQRPSARLSGIHQPMDAVAARASAGAPAGDFDGLDASTMPLIPVPRRRAPQRPFRATGRHKPSKAQPAPVAPTSTESEHSWLLEDDEAGFDGAEDRTMIDPGVLARLAAESNHVRAPALPPLPGADTLVDRREKPTVSVDADSDSDVDAFDGPTGPVRRLNPRRRSGNLPRPRLTRSGAIKPDRLPLRRGIAAELKTLDFFIERGFVESALALLAELEKRHPNHDELRLRKQRIAALPR